MGPSNVSPRVPGSFVSLDVADRAPVASKQVEVSNGADTVAIEVGRLIVWSTWRNAAPSGFEDIEIRNCNHVIAVGISVQKRVA